MNSLSFDQLLFQFFNGKHTPFFDWLMVFASNPYTWIPVYFIVVVMLIRALKFLNPSYIVTNVSLIAVCMVLMIFTCMQGLPPVFELFISRVKPCYDEALSSTIRTVGDVCNHKYGFYTFKTGTVFAISTFLWMAFEEQPRWLRFLLIFWALLVSYSRIYMGAHYPVDVLVSALSGAFVGYITYRIYYYIKDSVLVV